MRRVTWGLLSHLSLWFRPGRVQLGDGLWPGSGGMIAGLVIFLCGNRHFTHTRGLTKRYCVRQTFSCPTGDGYCSAGGNACADYRVVLERVVGYALIVATIIGLGVLAKIYRKQKTKNSVRSWG